MKNINVDKTLDELIFKLSNNEISKDDFKFEIMQMFNCEKENDTRKNSIKRHDVKISGEPIVSIINLTKHYKGRTNPAINNISFNIYPGQFHAFIGANGAGKTTTIKSIISAYSNKKYKGEIKINGCLNFTADGKSVLGYIPEEAKFPKKMSTKNYLISMACLSGLSNKDAKQKVNTILTNLGLTELENKCPDSFSSGQKKKILLAQALIHDPKVLIMDEPAANLDPLARDELFENLINLQKEGKAIFLSSHILDEIGKYATYVTILDGGSIVYDGSIDKNTDLSQLYRKYVKLGSVDTGIK